VECAVEFAIFEMWEKLQHESNSPGYRWTHRRNSHRHCGRWCHAVVVLACLNLKGSDDLVDSEMPFLGSMIGPSLAVVVKKFVDLCSWGNRCEKFPIPESMRAQYVVVSAGKVITARETVTFKKTLTGYEITGVSDDVGPTFQGKGEMVGAVLMGQWEAIRTDTVGSFFLERSEKGSVLYGFFSTLIPGGNAKASPWILGQTEAHLTQGEKIIGDYLLTETPIQFP